MSSVRPVTKQAHASARWRPFKNLEFAAGDAFAPLVMSEARRAAVCMPIAFFAHEGVLQPVAMQGLKPGKNLLVAPDGRWVPPYIPAVYRGYPFSVRRDPEGTHLLCVDEGSDLVRGINGDADDGKGDANVIDNDEQPFFDAGGEMSEPLSRVLEFSRAVARSRQATHEACAVLEGCDVLVPWEISFEEDGKPLLSKGLLRVDEARLNALDAEALYKLQSCGALNLLFCHLVSVSQVALLLRLNRMHSSLFDPQTDSVDELLGLPDDDVIEFGF